MNEKFRELIKAAGMEWAIQTEVDAQNMEELVKSIVQECIDQNTRTAHTMLKNELTDHCPPHMYNFEIRELFGMGVTLHSSEE